MSQRHQGLQVFGVSPSDSLRHPQTMQMPFRKASLFQSSAASDDLHTTVSLNGRYASQLQPHPRHTSVSNKPTQSNTTDYILWGNSSSTAMSSFIGVSIHVQVPHISLATWTHPTFSLKIKRLGCQARKPDHYFPSKRSFTSDGILSKITWQGFLL